MLPKWCSASCVEPGRACRGCVAASEADGWGLWGGIVRDCACCGRWCTRSVGITPLLIGCIATDRVQRDVTGVSRRNGCSASRAERGEHFVAAWLRGCVRGGRLGSVRAAVVLVVGRGAPDP